jgi:hypothetical protein
MEPFKHLYYALLVTFPLTIGLTIVFLIGYNTNWKGTSFLIIIRLPILLALLFLILRGISDKFGLQKNGTDKQQEIALQQGKKDNELPQSQTGNNIYNNLEVLTKDYEQKDSIRKERLAHPRWYEKYAITRQIAGAVVSLKESFITMYYDYGKRRFLSGILLAFFLSWYIQTYAINKLKAPIPATGN